MRTFRGKFIVIATTHGTEIHGRPFIVEALRYLAEEIKSQIPSLAIGTKREFSPVYVQMWLGSSLTAVDRE
jgi:hypothetical protein